MKRVLGPLLLVAVLTACGDEDGGAAEDRTSTDATPTVSGTATGSVSGTVSGTATANPGAPEVVDIVPGTAAGGEVATEATVIDDDQALESYLRQFESAAFVGGLTEVVQDHEPAEGRVLGLAVIAIGCDVPPSATVTEEGGAFVVTPGKIAAPQKECYAPVTSVAVLDLPAG